MWRRSSAASCALPCGRIQTEATPPAVAIDEAVRLAKRYSTDEAGAFVNGVLGAVARDREEADG